MRICKFDTTKDFIYHWCGKFVSPNEEWMHLTRNLIDYELFVVTDGTLYIADDAHKYEVLPGQYLLMPPTVFQHGYKSGSCSFYWMHFGYNRETNDHTVLKSQLLAPEELTYREDRMLLPIQGELKSLERITILMKQLQDSDRRYREATLNRFLCGAILAEIAVQSPLYQAYGNKKSQEQIYSDIVDYIHWHISENLRVAELAEYFGYNEKYLTTFFKKTAGIPIKQYILQEKMERAKAILTETNQPVSQIAYSLGFSDAHNFTNAFKKITELSPSEYRSGFTKRNLVHK